MKGIAAIRKLPVAERLQLVGEMWDPILEDPDLLPVSDELVHELEHRLAAHQRDPRSGIPWQEVDRAIFGTD